MKQLVVAIGFHALHMVFAIEDRASVWAGCFAPYDCKTKDQLPNNFINKSFGQTHDNYTDMVQMTFPRTASVVAPQAKASASPTVAASAPQACIHNPWPR